MLSLRQAIVPHTSEADVDEGADEDWRRDAFKNLENAAGDGTPPPDGKKSAGFTLELLAGPDAFADASPELPGDDVEVTGRNLILEPRV